MRAGRIGLLAQSTKSVVEMAHHPLSSYKASDAFKYGKKPLGDADVIYPCPTVINSCLRPAAWKSSVEVI